MFFSGIMHGQVTGPNLGCVLKLGYRRPMDDNAAYLGDFTWETNSDDQVVAAFDNNSNSKKCNSDKMDMIKSENLSHGNKFLDKKR